MERTFVMVKPEGVTRRVIGKVITTIEEAGIKIRALKTVEKPPRVIVAKHYPNSADWLENVGKKTLKTYADLGKDVKSEWGTDNPVEIGKKVKEWLVNYISSGTVVCMVLEGNHVVENAKRIVGPTIPLTATPGTIRSRFSIDSPDLGNAMHRPVSNIVHVSGSPEEAQEEIQLWFKESEIVPDYTIQSDETFYKVW